MPDGINCYGLNIDRPFSIIFDCKSWQHFDNHNDNRPFFVLVSRSETTHFIFKDNTDGA